jgi:hypothetical protein
MQETAGSFFCYDVESRQGHGREPGVEAYRAGAGDPAVLYPLPGNHRGNRKGGVYAS